MLVWRDGQRRGSLPRPRRAARVPLVCRSAPVERSHRNVQSQRDTRAVKCVSCALTVSLVLPTALFGREGALQLLLDLLGQPVLGVVLDVVGVSLVALQRLSVP